MSFFRPDSEVMEFISKVADIVILNLLCFFCSIPVVTIGAAFTARNYAAMKIVRGEEPSVVKSFFKSFRVNFKQITMVWLGVLVVVAILGFDWYNVFYGMAKTMPFVGKVALAVISFIVWSFIYCMFYFEARYEVATKELIKASMVMAILNLPRMVLIFIAIFLPYLICAWYIQWGLAIWLLTTTVALYLISKEFNSQLDMITKGEGTNESGNIETC